MRKFKAVVTTEKTIYIEGEGITEVCKAVKASGMEVLKLFVTKEETTHTVVEGMLVPTLAVYTKEIDDTK